MYSFNENDPNPIWDMHIDIILKTLYNNRNYISKRVEDILLENNIHLTDSEISILKWHIMLSRCVEVDKPYLMPTDTSHPYKLTEIGIQVMIAYGSYTTYIKNKRKADKKEERRKNFSHQLKSTQIIFGITGSVIATVLLIIQSISKLEISEQEKRIQYLEYRVDSLYKNLQPQLSAQPQ